MRPTAGIALTCLTAVSAAALSVVAVNSAGSDGLSDTSLMKSADFSTIFSGGSASDRVSDDPDAPIRTSRFDAPQPTVELAGGAPVTEIADAASAQQDPALQVASLERESDPAERLLKRVAPQATPEGRPPVRMAALSAGGGPLSTIQPGARPFGLLSPGGRVALSLTTNESPLNPGSGLTLGARDNPQNPAAQQIPPRSSLFDSKRLGLQIDVSPETSQKGRWFLFAASSGDAVGFNLFGDPAKSGRRRSSWSVEKLAEFGKLQLGIGWRKGPMQISGVATQREIGAYGYQREDTVFGISFTVSGGKRLPAPKARRGIPRGD
ncbi:MAG: hypothetical protein GC145_15270 [Caulobacter sp.]|nr:hypothetical protein [Caulobacter sp.]